ncbi:MAG: hypothetical protein AAF447_08940 [Myxococcota bacterium]
MLLGPFTRASVRRRGPRFACRSLTLALLFAAGCSRVELSPTPASGARSPDAAVPDGAVADAGPDVPVDLGPDGGLDAFADLALPDMVAPPDAFPDLAPPDLGVPDGGDGGVGPVTECAWTPRAGRVTLVAGDALGPASYDIEGEDALLVVRNAGGADVLVGLLDDDAVDPRRIAVDVGMSPIAQVYGAGAGFVIGRESCFAQGVEIGGPSRVLLSEGNTFASGPCSYGLGRSQEGIVAIAAITRGLQFTGDAEERPTGARLGEAFNFDAEEVAPTTRLLLANDARTLAHRFDPSGRGSRFRAASERTELDTRTLDEVLAVAPEGRGRGTLVLAGRASPQLLRYPAEGGAPEVLDLPDDFSVPAVASLASGSRHALLLDAELTLHAIPLVPGLMRQELAVGRLLGGSDTVAIREARLVSHAPTDALGIFVLRDAGGAARDTSWRAFRCRE